MMNSQKDMPVIVGNFFIDSLNKYLKNLPQEEFETLDKTIQNVYYARIEASRIKEQYGCEPPLGFVRTTKAYTIPANSHIGIHGLTKVKHGGWSVNVVNENPQITPLPHGLNTESTLSQLSPGSNRILVAMSNYSDQDITIPAKTIISQLSLGNKVPKMIYPGDAKDSELINKDEALKYEHFEQHKLISEELKLEPEEYIPTPCDKTCDQSHTVEVEDLGPDLEEDIEFQNSYTDDDKPNLGKSDQPTSSEEDDGSWILKLIDLSGLEKWSEDDKNAAIEMIKRNANIFSKNDMDMGRTNLVKHHIELTDPIPFKESYRRIPPQMYEEVKTHIQEMLDLGAIRHSNSPWSSAIVLVRKKDGRLRFCIDLRKLNNRTVKDAYSLPRIETHKCQFFKKKIVYMGLEFQIQKDKVCYTPLKDKCDAIRNLESPKTLRQTRAFCGMVNFLSSFLPNLRRLLIPICDLQKKAKKFKWTEEAKKAFNKIKKLLINPPVLKAPTPDGLFQLESNTLREDMGGTLLQNQGDEWVVIGYHSKRLPKSVKNFGITELELTGLLLNIHGFMQLLRNIFCSFSRS